MIMPVRLTLHLVAMLKLFADRAAAVVVAAAGEIYKMTSFANDVRYPQKKHSAHFRQKMNDAEPVTAMFAPDEDAVGTLRSQATVLLFP